MEEPTKRRHYENSILVPNSAREIFSFVNDHSRFSSHMTQSSWMMGGGRMEIKTDEGNGQKVGSHIKMSGRVFGLLIFLDEVVTEYHPHSRKVWKTVGDLRLLVIGHYQLGFEITSVGAESRFKVFINYDLPTAVSTRWLGYLFGDIYARWCVQQLLTAVKQKFTSK